MAMEFGLFYEIPVPRRGRAHRARRLHAVVAQAVRGEEVGFTHFWTVEHHFLGEFSHCSAPEVLYGAVAARTSRIKIGHGVRLLPFPYNHPMRVAEMAATLDCLCDGRLEFGTGRSSTRAELEGFGIDPDETRDMWEEALDVVIGAWTNDVFEERPLLQGAAAPRASEAAPAAASAAVDGVDQPGQPRDRGPARARAAVVHHRRAAGGAGGRIQLYRDGLDEAKPVGQVRQPARRHVHHGALRGDQRGGASATPPSRWSGTSAEHRADRHARHLAGGAPARARHLRVRRSCCAISTCRTSPSTCSTRWAPSSSATRRAASSACGAIAMPAATSCSA